MQSVNISHVARVSVCAVEVEAFTTLLFQSVLSWTAHRSRSWTRVLIVVVVRHHGMSFQLLRSVGRSVVGQRTPVVGGLV